MIKSKADGGAAAGGGGGRSIDPTANVLQLVEAAVDRLNDLADAHTKRIDERLTEAVEHIKELMALRDTYMTRLAEAEAKRIDAIRAVDVSAVAVDREKATQQASVLATQVAASAETLRSLVAQTAATIAAQLTQLTAQLTDRLSLLEKAQYENKGRSGVSDPADIARDAAFLAALKDVRHEIGSLRETRVANVAGVDQSKAIWAYVLAALGAAGILFGIFAR